MVVHNKRARGLTSVPLREVTRRQVSASFLNFIDSLPALCNDTLLALECIDIVFCLEFE